MKLLLLTLGLLLQENEQSIREQVDAVIREEYGNQELRELGKMNGARAVVMKMINEGDKRLSPLLAILGRLKAKEAEEMCLKMLKHTDPAVRVSAAGALAKLECRKATDEIATLLKDPGIPETDKADVAWALGQLGDPKALDALKAYQEDLRRRNVKLGNPNLFTKHAIVKLDVVATDEPVLREKKLADLLVGKHENAEGRELRLWAAGKLADYKCANAIPLIRSILADLTEESGRAEALEAVRRLGGKLSEQETEALKKHGTN